MTCYHFTFINRNLAKFSLLAIRGGTYRLLGTLLLSNQVEYLQTSLMQLVQHQLHDVVFEGLPPPTHTHHHHITNLKARISTPSECTMCAHSLTMSRAYLADVNDFRIYSIFSFANSLNRNGGLFGQRDMVSGHTGY